MTAGSAPLYAQVTDMLRTRIEGKHWKPGDRLPAEQQLCQEFRVSSITMRRALASLVAEGKLVRHQGRGTFVADSHHLVLGPPRLSSFSEDLQQRGWASTSKVLRLETISGPEEITSRLGMSPGAELTVLRRLRLADDEPIGIQTAWLPAHLAPDLDQASSLETESLYEVLRRDYGITATQATETFSAALVETGDADLLTVPAGSAAFRVERLTTDGTNRPIEFVRSVIRGDRYTVALNLSRLPAGIGS
ncbi:GntR family transcriptional regulator [Kribbella kalugense]|uniref:GntR family transcriptional regulator n=1 Tax=Kribbella kalugense TaxID=2512221 RepID=A0A4R8A467_9ACTN|nr:GntR family transcriptional regulator [Kribbella kalugense]TDW24258.1 GntR family transcriptional regulator [Kribbella kalugense]